ncbi:hypothetical protein [Ekhidna sp.]|uniref:hypothetical protein n=1 Tax=Ekhidna sp. TaxID=2608089 RepID=UPI003516EADC
MKKLLILFLTMFSCTVSLCQKTESLDGMSQSEIRSLLLKQNDSDEAREMIVKHNRSRVTSYVFFTSAIVLGAIAGSSKNPDKDNKNSIIATTYAWTSGLVAIACTIAAEQRFKKAKAIYLNQASMSTNYKPFLRSELEIHKWSGR